MADNLSFLISVAPAFGQGRGINGGSRNNAAAAAIDYEAIRQQRVATAQRVREKITIDGKLEEPPAPEK